MWKLSWQKPPEEADTDACSSAFFVEHYCELSPIFELTFEMSDAKVMFFCQLPCTQTIWSSPSRHSEGMILAVRFCSHLQACACYTPTSLANPHGKPVCPLKGALKPFKRTPNLSTQRDIHGGREESPRVNWGPTVLAMVAPLFPRDLREVAFC